MDDLDDDTKKIMLGLRSIRNSAAHAYQGYGIYWGWSEGQVETLRVALRDFGNVTWTDRSAEDIGHENHVSVEELSDDPPPLEEFSDDPPPLIDSTTGEIVS